MNEYILPAPDENFEAKRRLKFEEVLAGKRTDFSLFERDPGDFVDLAARVPGVYVVSAGGSFPFQAEGRLQTIAEKASVVFSPDDESA